MNEVHEDVKIALKRSTKNLIGHCGTLSNAADLCRVDRSRLSKYQNFDNPNFMPIDVVYSLQGYSGRTLIINELSRLHRVYGLNQIKVDGVRDELLDIVPAVGKLQKFVRIAKSEHSEAGEMLSPREKKEYFKLRQELDKELHDLDVAVRRDGVLSIAAE